MHAGGELGDGTFVCSLVRVDKLLVVLSRTDDVVEDVPAAVRVEDGQVLVVAVLANTFPRDAGEVVFVVHGAGDGVASREQGRVERSVAALHGADAERAAALGAGDGELVGAVLLDAVIPVVEVMGGDGDWVDHVRVHHELGLLVVEDDGQVAAGTEIVGNAAQSARASC